MFVAKQFSRPRLLALALGFLALLSISASVTPDSIDAHGELERSIPAAGAIQPAPPARVDLWFTEELDPSRSSIEVYTVEQQRVDTGSSHVDPADATHLIAPLSDLIDGTYTVAWRSASRTDSHVVAGTFTFRVGTARLPGAAASQDERPSSLAVGLRWVTLAGLSLTAGWFLVGLLGAARNRRQVHLAMAGAVSALLAHLAVVPAQANWPGPGLPRQDLPAALETMPTAWFFRLGLIILMVVVVALPARRWFSRHLLMTGSLLVVAALGTLVLTSHAAAQTSHRIPLMVANTLHLTATAFWLGGVAHFALVPEAWRVPRPSPLRRFSRLALLLALVAILTGILITGLSLPSLASLWQTGYGQLLLAKSVLVVGVLAFAWRNRRLLRSAMERVRRLSASLRAETALGGAALLVAASLAFSALPVQGEQQPLHLRTSVAPEQFAHLIVDPATNGNVAVTSWLAGNDDAPFDDVQSISVTFSTLTSQIELRSQRLDRQADGRWAVRKLSLPVKGWWEARVNAIRSTGEASIASFYLLLPDPTFARAERGRSSDSAAESLFQAAQAQWLRLASLRAEENLADGIGNSVRTSYRYVAPDKLAYATSSGNNSVAIGSDQYYQDQGGPWTQRQRVDPVTFPDFFATFYRGATGFTLGRQEVVDGELCQIISFYVPPSGGSDEAWYSWWMGVESQQVRREAMVAQYHYMTNHLSGQNTPIEIVAPQDALREP